MMLVSIVDRHNREVGIANYRNIAALPSSKRLTWSDNGAEDKIRLEKTPGGDRPHCKTTPNGQIVLKSIIKVLFPFDCSYDFCNADFICSA